MFQTLRSRALEHRLALCLSLCLLIPAAYFHGGAASNQNARLDAIYAYAEPGTPETGTFRIDRFIGPHGRGNTLDWAFYDGHYYSNKAPGVQWMGALAYKAILTIERWFGLSYEEPYVAIANAYLINLCVSVLPFVLGVLSLFVLVGELGAGRGHALWIALAVGLGTLWFPYSTQVWGHTTAAALTAMALLQVRRATPRSVLLAGALAGLAVCTDYLAVISAAAIGAWVLGARPKLIPRLLLGAAPLVLALMGYHLACFGGPFVTASQMSNPAFLEQDRALGMFGALSLSSLWSLTLGLQRGLFVQCPVLLLCAVGFYRWIRRAPRDCLPYVCLAAFSLYLLANASFNGWHGGATVGARYLICALPFLGLSLHALPWSRAWIWVSGVLFAVSLANMLAVAAVNPVAPDELTNPLYDYTYAMLFDGKLSPYPFSLRLLNRDPAWREIGAFAMFNLGELIGLRGAASLLPLLAGALGLALALYRLLGRTGSVHEQKQDAVLLEDRQHLQG